MKILEHVKMRNSVNRKFNHGVTVSDTKYIRKYFKQILICNNFIEQFKLFQIKLCMKYFPDNSRNTVLSQISMVLKTVHQPPSSRFSKNNLNTVHYSPENIYKADKLYLGRHPEMRSLIFLKRSFGIIIMYMYLPFHEHCHISRLCWMLFLLLKSFLR